MPLSDKRTFKLVTVPETIGASHLLVADKFIIVASGVPVFAPKVSTFISTTLVVVGAIDAGA